jgi:hypothetical protein
VIGNDHVTIRASGWIVREGKDNSPEGKFFVFLV